MNDPKTWNAEVLLRPPEASGTKLTAADLTDQVAATLRALGFEVLIATERSISIRGPQERFVEQLGAAPSANLLSESLPIPVSLRDKVEGIFVQIPPTYF